MVRKSYPMYDRLNVIFGKDRATRVGASTPIEMMNEPKQINEDEDEVETSYPSIAQRSSNSSTRKSKRSATNDNDLAMAFKEMLSESVDKSGEVLQAAFGK
ncbi:hypothetical protein C1H46_007337 [Malus baccata]|uniref:Uncharacterized protein n=1 Tax=Malus baccata TaxID=106549 RepID=A0A540N7T4_MALBA|nr:hypothetical protein C1H46_007337 [Malus baccata]